MKERDFLKQLESHRLGIFTTSDAAKITGSSGKNLNIFLYRLEKRKVISRLERGKYYLSRTPIEVIASKIISPSYVSFLSALAHHNLTTQIPVEIVIVGLKSRPCLYIENIRIRFMKIKSKRFFGMFRVNMGDGYFTNYAMPEKAITDCLAYPMYCPISEVISALEMLIDEDKLDLSRLINFVLRFDSNVVAKRIGYLLEINGLDHYSDLKILINDRYDFLNPYQPKKGETNNKWKLFINEVI
jgi:predicted transcriptional regulator of viral defense system